jgi:uncharacterized protein (DUF1501 family)
MENKRRQFIASALVSLPGIVLTPWVLRRAMPNGLFSFDLSPNKGRTLVVIQMFGGNDGLNTVIPYSDSRYYDYRPNLAVAQDKVLHLDNEVGFHPSLVKLKQLWDENVVAIVEGVGYPNPNYSHFESMRIWQTASPSGQFQDGWLGRYFDTMGAPPQNGFPGLAIGARTPPELYSTRMAIPAVQTVTAYRFQGDPVYPEATQSRLDSLVRLYDASPAKLLFCGALLDNTAQVASSSVSTIQTMDRTYQAGATYPNTSFGAALRIVAEAITANLGVAVCQAAIGSFDTHVNQEPTQSRLFTELGDTLYAFYQDLKAHGKEGDVVIMTWSEFGRRVRSNASNGTDHGSASPLFVIGKPVTGGLYGRRPDLGTLDNGNLHFTTDFRSVYATILENWLGVQAGPVLGPDQFERLPFFGKA